MPLNENPEKIFLYHYVEEMISSYGDYYNSNLKEEDFTIKELSILLRIRIDDVTTQHDLVNVFKVSGAYIAKVLRKFEDNGLILRKENPENRRQKLVKLTDDGVKKTDKLLDIIENWELEVTSNITDEELENLKKILFKILWG